MSITPSVEYVYDSQVADDNFAHIDFVTEFGDTAERKLHTHSHVLCMVLSINIRIVCVYFFDFFIF